MLLKRNILESVTVISCGGTVFCIFLHLITNISPLTGIWFYIYVFAIFTVSVILSIKLIQWLLSLNKPLTSDLEETLKRYPHLGFFKGVLARLPKNRKATSYQEYDTNELSVISTVLERKLVSSWYMPYISQEIGFPFACKQILDQMIGKTFQICSKIDSKDMYVDVATILSTHFKEYRKALKRQEKSPNTPIESLYKKVHPISESNKHSADHCTKILRVMLKELVPWELWDTPYSELLVRILSKKLDHFIDTNLSNTVWLNDKLMTALIGKEKVEEPVEAEVILDDNKPPADFNSKPQADFNNKPLSDFNEVPIEHTSDKISFSDIPNDMEAHKVESVGNIDFGDIASEVEVNEGEPVEVKTTPILRQRRGRQGRNEVKIYDRIIEGSVATWQTDVDLQCISLGQDLLASLEGELPGRLWGPEEREPSPHPPANEPLWFGEEDIDLEDSPKERSPVKKELSPKPAELLKDLQSTVHVAKTKIGDLQVVNVDVPAKSGDEAAGMMEGLLDFGIAGLKKGLRFTGLSDESQEKSPSHIRADKSPTEVKPLSVRPSHEPKEAVLQKDDNGTSTPHLVKQQRVTSQDSMLSQSRPLPVGQAPPAGPAPLPPVGPAPLPDSPEPQYEEAADLSTSIAKLRSLLNQRADAREGVRGEEVWWGEEARPGGVRVDSAVRADEYDMISERSASPGLTPNNMQRLDKLFHRTVTGVFNSLKTAVAAEGQGGARGGGAGASGARDWAYVCTSAELSVGGAVARLVGSRRLHSHVDTALDSLRLTHTQSDVAGQSKTDMMHPEDFEEWCASCGAGWSVSCVCVTSLGACVTHVVWRAVGVILAEVAETLIETYLDELTAWVKREIFAAFEQMSATVECNTKLREFDVEQTCAALIAKVPELNPFGEDTLSQTAHFIVSSLSHHDINKDIAYRCLDVFTSHFKTSAGMGNPSFDSN